MTDDCEFSTFCPIFALLQDPSHRIMRETYCHGKFGECKRRQMMLAGETVDEDMLPYGGMASTGSDRPHTIL